jgi:hypothetical protein
MIKIKIIAILFVILLTASVAFGQGFVVGVESMGSSYFYYNGQQFRVDYVKLP